MIAAAEAGATGDRGFTIHRTFHAPVPAVFRLWTDPGLVRQWWGIRGSTIPTCRLDVRVGGEWYIEMLTASGKLYPNHGVYCAVLANSYLEYTDIPDPELDEWAGSPPGTSIHSVKFEAEGGTTHLTFEVTLATAMDRARLLALGVREGWMQSLARLATLIETEAGGR